VTDAEDDAVPAWCEHGPGAHDGGAPAPATAPVASRAWLLIEHNGPWAHSAVETPLPAPLGDLAAEADRAGIRVQLIRRPQPIRGAQCGPEQAVHPGQHGAGAVFAAWTPGPGPWMSRVDGVVRSQGDLDLAGIAEGIPPAGAPAAGPFYLVCVHARRDRCCGRFGVPLARALAQEYPAQAWETTHLGGHKHAANLALLPHGLYYGPVDLPAAVRAIEAYEAGAIVAHRYRGRAGHDEAWQHAEHARLAAEGSLVT
jgi:hypothetical protein